MTRIANSYDYSLNYNDAELAIGDNAIPTDDDVRSSFVIKLQLVATIILFENSMIVLPAFGTAATTLVFQQQQHDAYWTYIMLAFLGLVFVAATMLLIQPEHSHVLVCYWIVWWIWLVYSYVSLPFWITIDATKPNDISYVTGITTVIYTLLVHALLVLCVSIDIVARSMLTTLQSVTLLLFVSFVVLVPIPYNNAFLMNVSQLTCHAIGTTTLIMLINVRERSQPCSLYDCRIHTIIQALVVLYSSGYVIIVVACLAVLQSWCSRRSDLSPTMTVRRV